MMTSTAAQPIFPELAVRSRSGMSARSAMMPPSPLLSARMRNMRYFTVTTIVRDQKMSERTPRMSPGVGGPLLSAVAHWWSV